jgi:heme-degrading monooxygenase HmoA
MHAHINIWRLTDAGASSNTNIARGVAARLREQPGFHSYSVVRTGERELIVITMFETDAQLHAALQEIDGRTLENIHHVTAGEPSHHVGDVILHEMARR